MFTYQPLYYVDIGIIPTEIQLLEKLPLCLDEDWIENAIFPMDVDDNKFREISIMNLLLGENSQMKFERFLGRKKHKIKYGDFKF